MKTFFVTGGAGFIGSHFCDTALAQGHKVVAFDDLSTGREFFLKDALKNERFTLIKGDIRVLEQLQNAMQAHRPEWVVHFAANADVRRGTERTKRDLEYNTIGTWNVLESMRLVGCKRILFSSTGSVYGEPEVFPTPEDAPMPIQTSFYGASKVAGEAMISAHSFGFDVTGIVFRFVSIVGPRYTHGHVFDFLKQLRKDKTRLKVLGDGNQTKSYVHVNDLMAGLWTALGKVQSGFHIFNIGHDDALTVKQSIAHITGELGLSPTLDFAGGSRGWVGDSPRIQLDTKKLKALGWKTQHSLGDSIRETVRYLSEHSFLLEEHA